MQEEAQLSLTNCATDLFNMQFFQMLFYKMFNSERLLAAEMTLKVIVHSRSSGMVLY